MWWLGFPPSPQQVASAWAKESNWCCKPCLCGWSGSRRFLNCALHDCQFFSWDEGACSAPKEIWNSMMLVHWGNTMEKYKTSTTQYPADNWNPIPASWRGDHPCYDPTKDLVLPAWKVPRPEDIVAELWARYHLMGLCVMQCCVKHAWL